MSSDGGLLKWLIESGAEVSNAIHIAPSALGGLGAFCDISVKRRQSLFRVPSSCILTSKVACESPLGRAVIAAATDLLADDDTLRTDPRWLDGRVLLWIYIAIGRKDVSTRFGPYLASLPDDSPEPTCWSSALRKELAATPAGVALDEARDFVEDLYTRFASRLPAALGEALVPRGCLASAAELLWARGMCVSRAFPGILAAGACGEAAPEHTDASGQVVLRQTADGMVGGGGGSSESGPGCLLPFFDVLNHRSGALVTCTAVPPGRADSGVTFSSDTALGAGAELCNNYSNRSNEELLFCYGFCLPDNQHDSVHLSLELGWPSSHSRETFLLRRGDVLPAELLHALSRASATASGKGGDENEGGEGAAAEEKDDGEEEAEEGEECEEGEVEMVFGTDELGALHDALHSKLGLLEGSAAVDQRLLRKHANSMANSEAADRPQLDAEQRKRKRGGEAGGTNGASAITARSAAGSAAARKAEDSSRRLAIAMYREGMRQVLTDAIAALEDMLGESESGEEEEG